MPDFGFVGEAYTASSITQDAQECINLYPEIDRTKSPNERGVVALYPTPGFIARSFFGSPVEVRGAWPQPGGNTLFVVAGNRLFVLGPDFTGPAVATIPTSTGPVSMTDNGSSLFIADGAHRYAYTWGTGLFQTLVDGAFTGADIVDVIDNYVIYNDPGTNTWGCTDIASTVSSGLNFGRKDSATDNIISLIVNKREIFLLGERTSEVWVDAGLFPFPFQKLPGTNMQHGCAAKHSVARLGETFAFLAQDDRGISTVVQMNGYTPERISTYAIEKEIETYSVYSDAIGMSYQQAGHEFYVLNFPTADRTWCYDATTGLWHRRASRDTENVLHRERTNCAVFFQGQNLFGDYARGLLYEASLSSFTDYSDIGNPIPRIRRARHLTSDLKQVYYHDFQIQFQPGVGLATGQGSDPKAMLRYSDDGGFTWSSEKWAAMGKTGRYKNRCRWPGPLGMSRDRIFEVTITDPVFSPIISANLNWTEGAV
jgi:hypothetical protein